ncbi:MAG: sodium:solute symporter family protein [Rikenellaceae bacterium]
MINENYKLYIATLLFFYTLIISFIGYKNRRSSSNEDYFLASRKLPAWLLAITFIASWWGGGSAIDLVDQANAEGLSTFWIYGVPVLLSTALMFIFSGGIRRIATISQPEIMERRYDARSAFMLSIFIIIFMVIGSAVQVIVVGRFFESFFGMSYETGAVVGTMLVVVYSVFGGFRGVVLTDLLQFGFFLISGIILFIIAYNSAGGFSAVGEIAQGLGRINFTDINHNLSDNLAYVITFGTSWMVQANVWQRISAADTPRSARKMMAISFVLFIPLYLMVTLTGMLSIASYGESPQGGIVAAMLQAISNPWIRGLIFVGLCSAIMSTMDSMFNTGALSLTVDIYQRHLRPYKSSSHYVMVGRAATLLVAILALAIGIGIREVLTVSWIGADFIASGAFIPLIFGFLWRRGTSKGALYSMIFGLIFSSYNLAVALGTPLPVAWDIASAKQAIIGISLSAVIYFCVSLLTKEDSSKAQQFICDTQVALNTKPNKTDS